MESSLPPSSKALDLGPALAALPLFPLPQVVFFPGSLLPLHVFEPRYRTLVKDALSTHRMLSVVLITDPEALDAQGNPQIAKVAGVGEIIDSSELPDGRFKILLRGRARVSLEELPFVQPYRRAKATVLESRPGEVRADEVSALSSCASAFATIVRERDSSFDFRVPRDSTPGMLADLCAHHLIVDARERQNVLETLDASARVRKVTEILTHQRLTFSDGRRTSFN